MGTLEMGSICLTSACLLGMSLFLFYNPNALYVKDFFLLYDNYCSLYDIFLFSSPIPSSCQGRKKRLQ